MSERVLTKSEIFISYNYFESQDESKDNIPACFPVVKLINNNCLIKLLQIRLEFVEIQWRNVLTYVTLHKAPAFFKSGVTSTNLCTWATKTYTILKKI